MSTPVSALSDEESDRIYREEIWRDHGEIRPSVPQNERPKAVMIGGQPGAGKGNVTSDARAEFARTGRRAVEVDPDNMRKYYPGYDKMDPATRAGSTQADASRWADRLENQAIAERKNVIIDGTLKTRANAEAKAVHLHKSNYETDVRLLGVNTDKSVLGIHGRYENATERLRQGKDASPRQVPHEVHNKAAEGLLGSADGLHDLQTKGIVDRVTVFDRSGMSLYDSKDPGQNRHPTPKAAIEAERNRPMDFMEKADLRHDWDKIESQQKDRAAPPNEQREIAPFAQRAREAVENDPAARAEYAKLKTNSKEPERPRPPKDKSDRPGAQDVSRDPTPAGPRDSDPWPTQPKGANLGDGTSPGITPDTVLRAPSKSQSELQQSKTEAMGRGSNLEKAKMAERADAGLAPPMAQSMSRETQHSGKASQSGGGYAQSAETVIATKSKQEGSPTVESVPAASRTTPKIEHQESRITENNRSTRRQQSEAGGRRAAKADAEQPNRLTTSKPSQPTPSRAESEIGKTNAPETQKRPVPLASPPPSQPKNEIRSEVSGTSGRSNRGEVSASGKSASRENPADASRQAKADPSQSKAPAPNQAAPKAETQRGEREVPQTSPRPQQPSQSQTTNRPPPAKPEQVQVATPSNSGQSKPSSLEKAKADATRSGSGGVKPSQGLSTSSAQPGQPPSTPKPPSTNTSSLENAKAASKPPEPSKKPEESPRR